MPFIDCSARRRKAFQNRAAKGLGNGAVILSNKWPRLLRLLARRRTKSLPKAGEALDRDEGKFRAWHKCQGVLFRSERTGAPRKGKRAVQPDSKSICTQVAA